MPINVTGMFEFFLFFENRTINESLLLNRDHSKCRVSEDVKVQLVIVNESVYIVAISSSRNGNKQLLQSIFNSCGFVINEIKV